MMGPRRLPTLGHEWSRVPHDGDSLGGEGNQTMLSVIAGGPGLLAVGRDVGVRAAAVWCSADGHTWQRLPHDDAVFGGADLQEMAQVTQAGAGFVAVGADAGRAAAAVWTSPDGRVWQRVPHREDVFGGPGQQRMAAVTAHAGGLVAVGSDGSAAAVWTSADGRVWRRVAHDKGIFDGPGRHRMRSVLATAHGLVAVGGGGPVAAVWRSPDGHTWQRSPVGAAPAGPQGHEEMRAVVSGGPGLVAVGRAIGARNPRRGGGSAAVWVSPDGSAFQRLPHDETVFGGSGHQAMKTVGRHHGGLTAAGWDGGRAAAAVWTSPDGLSWTRLPHDEDVFGGSGTQVIWSLTEGGPGCVAVGDDAMAAAVWVRGSALGG